MTWMRRLHTRLFVSYALVAATSAGAVLVTTRLLAPSLFDHEVGMGPRSGMPSGMPGVHHAFDSALGTALWAALAAGLAVAAVTAAFVARRILQPLDAVRDATRRLAEGRYDEPVPLPRDEELAALAADVNCLAQTLHDTETRRVRLVSDVAHELRTPLTTIEGYMQGLVDGVFEPGQEVFIAVSEEVARLERLASDLGALSRAEEGAVELHPIDADLRDIAVAVADRLRVQFDDKGVTLGVAPGPALPVRVDPDRLTQVFTNLLGNALTYTPHGEHVTVESGSDEESVWVAIADTGRGLSTQDLEHVFERFYRVDATSRQPGGSGIGLTIARSLARAHAGDIAAISAGLGRGATFTVRIPRASAKDQ